MMLAPKQTGTDSSVPRKSHLPKNVSEFRDRHGNWHVRFRAKGRETYYFRHRPGTDEFVAELEACRSGKLAPRVRTHERVRPGSISALLAIYYQAPEFQGLKQSTQTTYRGILERFRVEYGDAQVQTLRRQHIKAILGGMSDRPSAANNLLDRLRALMRFAIEIEWRENDPTHMVRGYKIKGDGFHTWTEAEIEQFERRHPPGSKARLAMFLMLYTGQRRSDVVTMGRQHLEDNRIRVRQQKTGAWLSIPMHRRLAEEVALLPEGKLTFLVTEYGKPHSAKGFGEWMRKRCAEAGLADCTSHGLRKAAARRLAEAGCSNQEIKSITGHKTDKEVARYTAAADQERLSDRAMKALGG